MNDMTFDGKPLFAWMASAIMTMIPRENMDYFLSTTVDIMTIIALLLTSAYTIYRWVALVKNKKNKTTEDD